jgi:hypothetical protein
MPYVGFGREERQPVARPAEDDGESSSLIERHVEEGVLKPSATERDYEQPLFIRCLKGCAGLGVFVHGRVCAVLSRTRSQERRFDALDGRHPLPISWRDSYYTHLHHTYMMPRTELETVVV